MPGLIWRTWSAPTGTQTGRGSACARTVSGKKNAVAVRMNPAIRFERKPDEFGLTPADFDIAPNSAADLLQS
jgi:hypothetical protein